MRYSCFAVGKVIRMLRKERNLSQEILSGLSGISRSHLALIENGKKSANLSTLWSISDALQIPLSQLIELVEKQISNDCGGDCT